MSRLISSVCVRISGMTKRLDTKTFTARAQNKHGNKFDYSKVQYIKNHEPVIIICPEHGEFSQAPSSHLTGRGCPSCGKIDRGKTRVAARISRGDVLALKHPELMIEWDTEKNSLDPTIVPSKSNEKAWWVCPRGHSYHASISNRVYGSGCPTCGGQSSKLEILVLSYLSAVFDRVEWREKLDGMEVDFFILSENTAVEVDGYPWHRNSIEKDRRKSRHLKSKNIRLIRLRDSRNPKISGEIITYENDKRKSIRDSIIKCIKLAKNEDSFSLTSYRKLKQRRIFDELISRYPGPPDEKSLAFFVPEIFGVWSEKNVIPPDEVWAGSRELFWIVCKSCGTTIALPAKVLKKRKHLLCAACERIERRTARKRELPYRENNLAAAFPEIAAEWSKKNKSKASEVSYGSNVKALWLCPRGHEYEAPVTDRTRGSGSRGSGCPYCAGKRVSKENSLAANFPALAEEWDVSKNAKSPNEVTVSSGYKAHWICAKCKFQYPAKVYNRTVNGSGCPSCAGKVVNDSNSLAKNYPDLAREWSFKENLKTPDKVMVGSHYNAYWECMVCSNVFQAVVRNRVRGQSGCSVCAAKKTS